MVVVRFFCFCLFALLFVTPVLSDDDHPERREQLATAIPEGIRLLEAKEFESFLKSFVPPEDLKRITEETSLAEFAKTFGQRKAPRLLEVLTEIKDEKPVFGKNETEATYTLKKEIGGKKSLTFVMIDKYWYIRN
jgi:hypothetical protein